jgi:hypothetical protein
MTGVIRGHRPNGLRSDGAQAAYWRMQWESCQEALAMVMAENTENFECLRDIVIAHGECDHDGEECLIPHARDLVAHALAEEATP